VAIDSTAYGVDEVMERIMQEINKKMSI